MKILIIEDDKMISDMYKVQFELLGHDVTISANGPEGLIYLEMNKPDLVLLDLMMPVMDGFELMEKMKEEKLAQNAIFIILSNRGQPSDIARGESLGASGYIVKASSTPSEVIDKVNAIINNLDKK